MAKKKKSTWEVEGYEHIEEMKEKEENKKVSENHELVLRVYCVLRWI